MPTPLDPKVFTDVRDTLMKIINTSPNRSPQAQLTAQDVTQLLNSPFSTLYLKTAAAIVAYVSLRRQEEFLIGELNKQIESAKEAQEDKPQGFRPLLPENFNVDEKPKEKTRGLVEAIDEMQERHTQWEKEFGLINQAYDKLATALRELDKGDSEFKKQQEETLKTNLENKLEVDLKDDEAQKMHNDFLNRIYMQGAQQIEEHQEIQKTAKTPTPQPKPKPIINDENDKHVVAYQKRAPDRRRPSIMVILNDQAQDIMLQYFNHQQKQLALAREIENIGNAFIKQGRELAGNLGQARRDQLEGLNNKMNAAMMMKDQAQTRARAFPAPVMPPPNSLLDLTKQVSLAAQTSLELQPQQAAMRKSK